MELGNLISEDTTDIKGFMEHGSCMYNISEKHFSTKHPNDFEQTSNYTKPDLSSEQFLKILLYFPYFIQNKVNQHISKAP